MEELPLRYSLESTMSTQWVKLCVFLFLYVYASPIFALYYN